MKKLYNVSRIVLCILSFLIFNIMIINEDKSWLIIPFIFAMITYGLSFPCTIISKKMLTIGNRIESKLLKVLYYVFLPMLLLLLCYITYVVIYFITHNVVETLGQALLTLGLITIICVGIILPYIQTLIVLILKQFAEND